MDVSELLPFTYFVSYFFERGFGSIEHFASHPIDRYEDIVELGHQIERKKGLPRDSVVVLVYKLLHGPAESADEQTGGVA